MRKRKAKMNLFAGKDSSFNQIKICNTIFMLTGMDNPIAIGFGLLICGLLYLSPLLKSKTCLFQ